MCIKIETNLNKAGTPVFEGHFHAKHIVDENYLAKCGVYLNSNLLKHKIVQDIEVYPWMSYHQLTQKEKQRAYKDLILEELGY